MTRKEIEALAKVLYEKVLARYMREQNMSFGEYLDEELRKFDDATAAKISSDINDTIAKAVAGGAIAVTDVLPITINELSSRLYRNSKETAKVASAVINEHLDNKSTINEIRKSLYDGYGYEELLPIKKKLPRYLSQGMDEAKIAGLKTKSLKAAYLDVLYAKNDKQLAKALKVALEEKARYYALRIAVTEEQKYWVKIQTAELIRNSVKYVKVTLSAGHKIRCVCDDYAERDIGYGAGVYPLMDAPMPVYHPFCRCILVEVTPKKWRDTKPDPIPYRKWHVPTVREVF